MALFGGKEAKEEKKEAKMQAVLQKYGLESMTGKDAEAVRNIAYTLSGNNLIELGTTLSGKAEDVAKLTYLRAIVEQNFILVRQLNELKELLKNG